ncbi:MAG: hypothetical protein ACOYOU_20535, partial [Kiritimatiellia bacterium]
MIGTFQLGALLAMCADFAIGALVFFANTRRMANRVFFAMSAVMVFWVYCQFRGSGAPGLGARDLPDYLFWVRQASTASIIIPVLVNMLRLAIEQPEARLPAILRASIVWLICAAVTAVLCQCPAFLLGGELPSSANELGVPLYGPLFTLFVAYWVFGAFALIRAFWRGMTCMEGVRRIELQFMALATFLGLVPGILFILVVPALTGNMHTTDFAPFSVVIWCGTLAYGIATRRIMGVAEFLRRLVTYLLVASFLALLYIVVFRLVWALANAWVAGINRNTLAHVAAGIAIALLLAPTNNFLQRRADQLFASGQKGLA